MSELSCKQKINFWRFWIVKCRHEFLPRKNLPVIYEFCIFCNCWTRSKYSMLMLHLMRQRTLRESPKWNLQSARWPWHCWYLDFGHKFRCSFTTTLPLPTHLINVIIYYVIRHDIQYCMILPTDSVVRSWLIARYYCSIPPVTPQVWPKPIWMRYHEKNLNKLLSGASHTQRENIF